MRTRQNSGARGTAPSVCALTVRLEPCAGALRQPAGRMRALTSPTAHHAPQQGQPVIRGNRSVPGGDHYFSILRIKHEVQNLGLVH